jgi:hypothetical protein
MARPEQSPPSEDHLACPYFMPVQKLENGNWPHPARLPLGAGWSGHCTAPGHEDALPAQDILEAFCNLGYADCCSWAPRDRAWDAVRFAISAPPVPSTARETDGARLIHLRYVCERDHLPVEHGSLEFDLNRAVWTQRHPDSRVQKMAECFFDSYLNRKS